MNEQSQLDERALRDCFGCFASGVTVISLRDENGKATGVTVSSFSSLSLSPALCLFTLGKHLPSARLFTPGCNFAVNVLSDSQHGVAWQFSKPLDDKFEGISTFQGIKGLPLIEDALAHFECTADAVHDGGDHLIIVGKIERFAQVMGDPLLFYRGQMRQLVQD